MYGTQINIGSTLGFLLNRNEGEREEIVRRLVEKVMMPKPSLSLRMGGRLAKNILDQRTDLGVTGLSLRREYQGSGTQDGQGS